MDDFGNMLILPHYFALLQYRGSHGVYGFGRMAEIDYSYNQEV